MSELTDHDRDQIIECLKAGQKIHAIRIYREATGEGLKEAKDFIDVLTERLADELPGQIPNAGCGLAILLFMVVSALLITSWNA